MCRCLETSGSRSQCFDVLQNGICKHLVRVWSSHLNAWTRRVPSSFLTLSFSPSPAADQAAGGSRQHGCRAAESHGTPAGALCPAQRGPAALPVALLPQPTGPALFPAARPTLTQQPQEVCVCVSLSLMLLDKQNIHNYLDNGDQSALI